MSKRKRSYMWLIPQRRQAEASTIHYRPSRFTARKAILSHCLKSSNPTEVEKIPKNFSIFGKITRKNIGILHFQSKISCLKLSTEIVNNFNIFVRKLKWNSKLSDCLKKWQQWENQRTCPRYRPVLS